MPVPRDEGGFVLQHPEFVGVCAFFAPAEKGAPRRLKRPTLALVDRGAASRHQAIPDGAQSHREGAVRSFFEEQGFAKSIRPSCRCHPEMRPICSASQHRSLLQAPKVPARRGICGVAGIRGQEAARGRGAKTFEFARVFRDRERATLHLPEFTMLEWYRADETMNSWSRLTAGLSSLRPCRRPASDGFRFAAKPPIRLRNPELLTVAAAFDRFAGIDH